MSIFVKLLNCIGTEWTHSNWEVRMTAVKNSSAADIKNLRDIAKTDKHPLVREEALFKLNDSSFLTDLARYRRVQLVVFLILFMVLLVCWVAFIPAETGGQYQPPTNSSSLDYIDNIISGMQFGNIAFNAPSTLTLGDETIIELLLSGNSTINELKQRLKAAGEKKGYRIRIANDMQANLWGRGFQCKAIMPQEQVISSSNTTYWKWNVQAIKGGKQSLHLTLSIILYINQHATQYAIKTFEHEINVQVTWRKQLAMFMGSYWQWIFTVMLIPTVAWSTRFWTKMRLRAKSNALKKPQIILPH